MSTTAVLSMLLLAGLICPSAAISQVVYDPVGGSISLDDGAYGCYSQSNGLIDCGPCINSSDTQLGLHFLPRSFVQSPSVVCNSWYGDISGMVNPRLVIDGVLINDSNLLPEGSYWECGAIPSWYWCPWDGTPPCNGYDCGYNVTIGGYNLVGGSGGTMPEYRLQFPAAEFGSGIPFLMSFCNRGFSWGVGCNAGGSSNRRWLLISPAAICPRAYAPGASGPLNFTGTGVDLQMDHGPGGIVTVTMVAGDPSAENLPEFRLPRYWEIKTEMIPGSFSGRLTIQYDPSELSSPEHEEHLKVLRYDEVSAAWLAQPTTVDLVSHRVEVQGITQFSKIVIAPRWGIAGRDDNARGTGTPLSLAISSVHPNPSSGRSVLRFGLPRDAMVDLRVHDIAGRVVKTLLAENRPAGWHEVGWDGSDDDGRPAVNGVYWVRIRAGEQSNARSVRLMRK